MHDLFSLKGRVALVTGASSGMGERFAQLLAERGASVICCARRKDRLDDLVASVCANGGMAIAQALDVTDAAQRQQAFEAAEAAFGTVDLLINNAGSPGQLAPLPEVSTENWSNVLDLNLTALFEMSKEFSRRLIAHKKPGTIVNIGSVASLQASPTSAPYSASKAGVTQLTKVMALDLAPHQIRVNCIAPGTFATEIFTEELLQSDFGKYAVSQIPLQRAGQVSDLDGLFLLLASDASSYITGAQFVIDGGVSVRYAGF